MLYRLLDSIELFADEVIINGTSETFARGSFAIQVQDYDPATFSGLDFAVELGPVEEAVNSTEDIDSDLIVSEVNDPTACDGKSVGATPYMMSTGSQGSLPNMRKKGLKTVEACSEEL